MVRSIDENRSSIGLVRSIGCYQGEVADQVITLTVMRNPTESLLPALWEKYLQRP